MPYIDIVYSPSPFVSSVSNTLTVASVLADKLEPDSTSNPTPCAGVIPPKVARASHSLKSTSDVNVHKHSFQPDSSLILDFVGVPIVIIGILTSLVPNKAYTIKLEVILSYVYV